MGTVGKSPAKSRDAYSSISRCTTSRNSPNGQLKRLREPSGSEFRQISGLVRQILGLLVRLVSKATRLRLKCTVPSHALKALRAPHKSLANVVEPPLERECGRTCDYFVAVGGAQAELHDEEDEDEPLQRKLNRDEGLALATRLYNACRR